MTASRVESARMVTPEAVALEFRTANLGSRILAYLIDMVVVVAGIVAGCSRWPCSGRPATWSCPTGWP